MKKGQFIVPNDNRRLHVEYSDYVVYSYDKENFTFEFLFPDYPNIHGEALLILKGDKFARQQYSLEIIDQKAKFVVPESILGYEGSVKGYLYLAENDIVSNDDAFMFTFLMRRSEIDSDLLEISNVYYKKFEDLIEELKIYTSSVKSQMEDMLRGYTLFIEEKKDKVSNIDVTLTEMLQDKISDLEHFYSICKDTMKEEVHRVSDKAIVAYAEIESMLDRVSSESREVINEMYDILLKVRFEARVVTSEMNKKVKEFDDILLNANKDINKLKTDFNTFFTKAKTDVTNLNTQHEVVIEDIRQKAATLETTYAPRLTGIEDEVGLARGEAATLGERLDEEHAEVTTQLAQTSTKQKKMNTEVIAKKNKKPMVSFVDDDCRSEVMAKWQQTLIDKKIPLGLAVITGSVGDNGYLTWEQLADLKNLGAVLENHTHTHRELATLNEQEIRYEFETSQEIFKEKGYSPEFIIYPYGSENHLVRTVAREYFRGGVDITGPINVPPIETYRVHRFELRNLTLADYIAKVDEAIQNDGWVIFMTHSQYTDFDATQQQHVRDIIDYARANGVDVVSLEEGYDTIGNIVDVGDYTDRAAGTSYTILDAKGNWHSNVNNIYHKRLEVNFTTFTKPITDFEKDKMSYSLTLTSEFPTGQSGLVFTRRDVVNDLFSYQIFMPYNSSRSFKRSWNTTTNAWNEFEITGMDILGGTDEFLFDTPLTNFTQNKITYSRVNTATLFPTGTAGTLITTRLSTDAFGYQTYMPYNTHHVYRRTWDTRTNTWNDFQKITTVKEDYTLNFAFGSIAANSAKDVSVPLAGITATDKVIINPKGVVPAGLMFFAYNNAANKFYVRVLNTTGSAVDYTSDFYVTIIKN